jgi:hypothetical protein
MSSRIIAKPINIKSANLFVKEHHRHHRPTTRNSGKWAISAVDSATLEVIGVVITGNPVSATFMDGVTLEITRLCVKEGAPKGTSSFLIAKCCKIWRLMGGEKLVTYNLSHESGASLRGAGWEKVDIVKPHNDWHYKSIADGKPRDKLEIYGILKNRWELNLN